MKQPMCPEKILPTVLIVDDTPANIGIISSSLENSGYRVLAAQDGEEGLQRAAFAQPDLILLDVMMPLMDGFEVCRRLKKQENTRDIPVIFMTARAEIEDKVNGFKAGAVDYVTKPLQIDEVISRVGTQLSLSTMQKRLEIQNAQLHRYREQLEQRVAERTFELAEANKCLQLEMHERNLLEVQEKVRLRILEELAQGGELNGILVQVVQYVEQTHPDLLSCIMLADAEGKYLQASVAPSLPDGYAALLNGLPVGEGVGSCGTSAWRGETVIAADLRTHPFWTSCKHHALQFGLKSCWSEPILDSSGTVLGTFSIYRYEPGSPSAAEMQLIRRASHLASIVIEQTRTRMRLHEREQEFRAMLENTPDIIARYDTLCRRIYVNPAMSFQFGLPVDEILGTTPLELSALPDPEHYIRRIQEVLHSAREAQFEFGFLDIQGGSHWGHMRLVPELDEDGAVASVLAITRDMTEHKRAEEALAVREREFRTLAENMPDNITRYDMQLRKVYFNSSMKRTTGADFSDLIGKTPGGGSNECLVDGDEYEQRLRQVMESGVSDEFEMPVRHAIEGEQVHNVRLIVERDEQEKVIGVLAIGRDITRRIKAEEALREREQRYREIFDNASDGLYLLEVTEDGRFRNLDVNPVFLESTGMRRDELIGRYVDETVAVEVAVRVIEKYRKCVNAGAVIQEEVELDLPVGRRYYHSTLVPIYSDGRVHRIVGISRDITQLNMTGLELEQSRAQLRGLTARREAAREEERKYIAREVHDELGQILTGLQLNVSVLTCKFAAKSQPLREQLQETRMLTDRALEVARNVASTLRPAALDMGIASALEWLIGRFSATTGIHCEMQAENMDVQLEENCAIALFRIVQESLTNVSRHSQASHVVVEFARVGDDYFLKIRDNGDGFDSSSRKMDSFGLVGMQERALLLDGTVSINSHPGAGTEIIVSIPVYRNSGKS